MRVQRRADLSERALSDHLEVAEPRAQVKHILHDGGRCCRRMGGNFRDLVVVDALVVVTAVVAGVVLGRRGTGGGVPAGAVIVVHVVSGGVSVECHPASRFRLYPLVRTQFFGPTPAFLPLAAVPSSESTDSLPSPKKESGYLEACGAGLSAATSLEGGGRGVLEAVLEA